MSAMELREGRPEDLPALLELYNHWVAGSHATFDTRPATLDERRAWLSAYRREGPHRLVVAAAGEALLGYATSSRYRDHPAFVETVETSVYVAAGAHGRGVGSALYGRLFELLRGERLHRAVAGIALPNDASVALHRRHGFREVGTFDEYALKNGRYVSSLWLTRPLP